MVAMTAPGQFQACIVFEIQHPRKKNLTSFLDSINKIFKKALFDPTWVVCTFLKQLLFREVPYLLHPRTGMKSDLPEAQGRG
jgi:hypothetical protein